MRKACSSLLMMSAVGAPHGDRALRCFFENGYGSLDRQAHPIFANLVAAKDYDVTRLERGA